MTRLFLFTIFYLLALVGCSDLRDTHERLHSVLWMQTSAEYRTLTTLIYQRAREALNHALADKAWTAVVEQVDTFSELPPAVIMDLDETVLDNSPFEARLIKARLPFSRSKWDQWVEEASAQALPGALEFIAEAQRKGITVFFVTNRQIQHEAATRENLEHLGISLRTDIDVVLTEGEQPHNWQADKSRRRQFLASQYRILLLIGDDLGDFVGGAMDNPDNRIRLSEQYVSRWGASWFLIPNPIYGSWEASLYRKGLSDIDSLNFKRSVLRDTP